MDDSETERYLRKKRTFSFFHDLHRHAVRLENATSLATLAFLSSNVTFALAA